MGHAGHQSVEGHISGVINNCDRIRKTFLMVDETFYEKYKFHLRPITL
jgi:membrane-anchored protein YejM (alkaline phosphatase superfamily)